MAALIEPSLAAALDRKMALRGKVVYTFRRVTYC